MKSYKMITIEQAQLKPLHCLINDYNDTIEMIWHLQCRLKEQLLENEKQCKAYEDISNELYG